MIITNYTTIKNQKILRNGDVLFDGTAHQSYSEFIKAGFRFFDCKYPKFFKMDNMSKLAFIGTEALMWDTDFPGRYEGSDIAVILQNRSASLDTDLHYFKSVGDKSNYFPNPALFVYTLANIMIGELCIKHKITGENTLFVTDSFEPEHLHHYVSELIDKGRAKCCITGWVDFFNDEYHSFLFLVEKEGNYSNEITNFAPLTIKNLFNQ